MRFDLLDNLVVDCRPNRLGDDRPQLLIGNLDAQIQFAFVPHVDDGAIRRAIRLHAPRADQKASDFFDRFLCRAQANPLQRPLG